MPLVNLKVEDSKLAAAECAELIYVSLGTVVNREVEPFLRLIDGIKLINKSTSEKRYKFLMSVGDKTHSNIQQLTASNKLELPGNLLVMPRVPQLDILKRASLFITHSGQGGTSEAIHYGVPMVCIPVMTDQPEVAYRVSDELGLGVQLNFDTFDGEAIKNAVLRVTGDKSYLERVLLYSQISRKYNGAKEATRITFEFLQAGFKKYN